MSVDVAVSPDVECSEHKVRWLLLRNGMIAANSNPASVPPAPNYTYLPPTRKRPLCPYPQFAKYTGTFGVYVPQIHRGIVENGSHGVAGCGVALVGG